MLWAKVLHQRNIEKQQLIRWRFAPGFVLLAITDRFIASHKLFLPISCITGTPEWVFKKSFKMSFKNSKICDADDGCCKVAILHDLPQDLGEFIVFMSFSLQKTTKILLPTDLYRSLRII
jgi:hypothetical protein